MTKKQLATLKRILNRNEQYGKPYAAYPSGSYSIITDGSVAIVSKAEVDGIASTDRNDALIDLIIKSIDNVNNDYVLTSTPLDLSGWRKLVRTGETITIEGEYTSGGKILQHSGFYNPRLVLDALDSVGTGSKLHIGKCSNGFTALFVTPKDWGYDKPLPELFGFVLPTRKPISKE